jgi:ribosomal protein S18 acetylase RimI-like enzyme
MTESTAVVRRPKLREMVALRRLFIEAVGGHFGYYPAEYREMILDQNRLHHLTVAHLHPHRPLYVASQNGRLMGYIIAGHDGEAGHVYWLYVDPTSRGQNLGLKLLTRALRDFERQGLNRVELNTHDHQRYYSRQGFKPTRDWQLQGVPMTQMALEFRRGSEAA